MSQAMEVGQKLVGLCQEGKALEVGIYTVADGKIVREEFLYLAG